MIEVLISLVVFIVITAILYWLVSMIPIPQPFKNIALGLLAIILLLIFLAKIGWLGHVGHI